MRKPGLTARPAWLWALGCSLLLGSCTDTQPERVERTRAAPVAASAPSSAAPLRLIIVSDLEGVLEPCGCAGRPAGGIDRVTAAVARLRAEATQSVLLLAGDTLQEPGSQERAQRAQDTFKLAMLSAVLLGMRIDALALGSADRPLAAAHLRALASDKAAPLVVGMQAGARLGITAEVSAAHSIEALRAEVAQLRASGAQLVLAPLQGNAQRALRVADEAGVDIVLQLGAHAEAPGAAALGTRAVLLRAGSHGEGLLVLDIWPVADATAGVRLVTEPPAAGIAGASALMAKYQSLDASAARHPAVRAQLAQLFTRINTHNAQAAADRAAGPPPSKNALRYVGSETCAACHTQAYFWWQGSAHGRAFETLVARGRELDFDCVACHVTGFDERAASSSGIAQRKGVGCESCHGPGSAHVDNPRPPLRGVAREVPEASCLRCHDSEHTRGFEHAERRLKLLVPGHGGPVASDVR